MLRAYSALKLDQNYEEINENHARVWQRACFSLCFFHAIV